MKKRSYLTITLFLIWFCASLNAQQITIPIVVIDPGHGGTDSGAMAINGEKEKDITLSIATKIKELYPLISEKPLELYLTRYTDTLIGLRDRVVLTKQLKANVFISIHCNQANNASAKGTEIFIYPKSKMQSKASVLLGQTIQKGLTDALGIKNRGIKHGNFQVLRDAEANTASVLLELGFLSQIDESSYLTKEDVHYAIALVILQSTLKYLVL